MRKLWTVVLLCGFALGGVGLWAFSSAEGKDKGERHPHIHRALNKLRQAKKDLREAAHKYGGHRSKALKDIDHAIAHLERALKHHPK